MRKTILYPFIILVFLFLTLTPRTILDVHAQPHHFTLEPATLDSFVEEQMNSHRIPGMAVAVTQGEEIVYLRAFNNTETGLLTPQTPFYIGSVSKSVTALAVMQLVEAGKLDLDQPVRTYLPWFTLADEAAAEAITVRHLLNQTSGFSRADERSINLPPHASTADAVRSLSSRKPSQPPGSVYQYFNANYTILGLLIETASGQTYGEYLDEHIFKPLEMEHSFTVLEEAELAGLAQGHSQMFGFPIPRAQAHLQYDLPAGFIMSSVEDMAHFMIAQMNDGRYREVQVLSPAGIAAMHRPVSAINSSYGMGWENRMIDDLPAIAHSGALETAYARAVMLPEENIGLFVLINQNGLLHLITFESMTEDMARLLVGSETQGQLSLKWVYLAVTAIILLDLARHGYAFARLPTWREELNGKQKRQLRTGNAAQILVPLAILIALPALLFATLGSVATRILIFNYLPEISLWIGIGAALSILRGLMKFWIVRNDTRIRADLA